jgi:genome maintenance exonuclease 1
MIIQRYNYRPLSRETSNGQRLYQTPDGEKLPSVTTILDRTKSEESRQALKEWKQRVGVKRAQEITTEAASRGTRMHKYLEDYVKNNKLSEPGSNPYSQQSRRMAEIVIADGLKNVDEFWGLEVPIYYPGLYAGTTDCAGVWQGQPAIIDFKQTNKPKKKEWIEDYFCQLVAYSLAHNEVYQTNIRTGVILMCSQNFEFQHWVIEGQEFDLYTEKWLDRVAKFYRISDK